MRHLSLSLILVSLAVVTPVVAQVADVFGRLDLDGDQRLSRREVDAGRDALFQRLDGNSDGRIVVGELRALAATAQRSPGERRDPRQALARLRVADRDGDRALDAAEFRSLGGDRFGQADLNGDGWLDPAEAQALRNLLDRP